MRADKAAKYLQLARAQAELFSKDPSTKVGALFLDAESLAIRTLGYNGFPRGIDETIAARWERPAKYLWVEHAERNGIYNAVRSGTPLNGTICIVTLFPCAGCARGLIQSGVRTLVAPRPDFSRVTYGEEFKVSLEMLTEAGVEIMYEDGLAALPGALASADNPHHQPHPGYPGALAHRTDFHGPGFGTPKATGPSSPTEN